MLRMLTYADVCLYFRFVKIVVLEWSGAIVLRAGTSVYGLEQLVYGAFSHYLFALKLDRAARRY